MTCTGRGPETCGSGGLDTSVAIRWINEKYDLDVIAVTVDVGNEKDFEIVRQKALRTGAIQAFISDAKESFVRDFAIPSLQAGTLYQNVYPLATALARPLIAKILVDYARQEGAGYVAHGCTGKGNDQVRFDVSIQALAPDLKIIAPVREWSMTRDDEIRYAQHHNIQIPVTAESPYSVDANLWGPIRWTPTCGAAASRRASSRTRGTSRPKTHTNGPSIRASPPRNPRT